MIAAKLYRRYPLTSILIYNGTTIGHYALGGLGIMLAYAPWLGWIYLVLAFSEMYIHMPLKVCPNCVYFRLDNSRCVAGLNVFSRRIAKEGKIKDFPNRARGIFCPNNLYLTAFALPIIVLLPALIIDFSYMVLGILLMLVGLLLFRFFIIFPRIACGHCMAKNICPNAKAMGFSNK